MELDIIERLLVENPEWLRPFPVVWAVEYYLFEEAKHLGRGDLVVCTPEQDRFLVVEMKRTAKNLKKLLRQMDFYHYHLKRTMPTVSVDCAAVAGGRLVAYRRDLPLTPPAPKCAAVHTTRSRRGDVRRIMMPISCYALPSQRLARSVVQHR